jgi:D-glycero-D-manno-heptose 1,7-bisphosphate phosphatase
MLVILDRDGVINYDSEDYIKSPDEWKPYPSSLAAIARLNAAGHKVVVATNQSGVGRDFYSLAVLSKIHYKMEEALKDAGGHLDGIYFCPHHPDDGCECRKPRPGMLFAIAEDFPDLFPEAVFVGDSARDMMAAKNAGCQGVLVKTGNGAGTVAAGGDMKNLPVYEDLAHFVDGFFEVTQKD